MARFTTDYVNLIVDNLRDRYKSGFPILKELIQNADDAGAKNLVFGHHPGFKEAVNQLLKGPALWLINDGRFLAEDKAAINSFGLNSKAAEKGAIGKFGLGMKSVFHLCEAFFYVGYDGTQEYIEVLSPWFQDGLNEKHADWEQFSQDDQDALLLKDIAHQQAENFKSNNWFLLWIPLRQVSHVAQDSAPIMNVYTDETTSQNSELFSQENIEQQIAALLPLLRHIEKVQFLGGEQQAAFETKLTLSNEHQRLDHISPELYMKGQIKDKNTSSEPLYFFAHQKALTNDPFFTKLKQQDAWPKVNVIKNRINTPVPDKAEAEGAVLFAHQNKSRGHLSIQWAVFLPVEEQELNYEITIPNSSREYRIVLHGQFFVDAGRRGIEGAELFKHPVPTLDFDEDYKEDEIHKAWNQGVAQKLVLPSFLPVLAQYIDQYKLTDNEVAALVGALKDCKNKSGSFINDFEKFICVEYSYVRRLTKRGLHWDLVKSVGGSTRFLAITTPKNNDYERPWKALPGLSGLKALFIDKNAPSLMLSTTTWSENDLLEVIRSMHVETLTSQIYLSYTVEFLSSHENILLRYSSIQTALVQRIQELLQHCSLSDIRQNRTLFIELINLLPENLVCGLGSRDTAERLAIPEFLYKKLLQVPTDTLLLPKDLTATEHNNPDIHRDTASAWLKVIGLELQQISTPEDSYIELVKSIFNSLKDKSFTVFILKQHFDLPLLVAFSARDKREIAISLKELRSTQSKELLFSRVALNERSFLDDLIKVVEDLNPLSITRDVRDYTKLNTRAPNDSNAVFGAIGAQVSPPFLNDINTRSQFLSKAISALEANDIYAKKGARYLLHGDSEKFSDIDSVLWSSSQTKEPEWRKLWQMVEPNTWAVLMPQLIDTIPPAKFEILNVKSIDAKSVIDFLKNDISRIDAIDSSKFSIEEKERILNHVKNDEELWKQLPFHRDTHGVHGPIDENCFLGIEPTLPTDIADKVRLIIPSQDKNLQGIQRNFIASWSPEEAAEIILKKHSDPSLHYNYLLDKTPQSKNANNLSLWEGTAWLKLSNGKPIAPKDIIYLPEIEDELRGFLEESKSICALSSQLTDEIQKHINYKNLHEILFDEYQSLRNIADEMVRAGYSLGANIQINTDTTNSLSALSALKSVPGWRIINNLSATIDIDILTQHVTPKLNSQLITEQVESALLELSSSADTSKASLFINFVKEWINSDSLQALKPRLGRLTLLAKDNSFQPATQLVAGVSGIQTRYELHPELVNILGNIIDINRSEKRVETDDLSNDSSEVDSNYDLDVHLRQWIQDIPTNSSSFQSLGAAIGMFGTKAKDLTEHLLSPISYESYINQLNWQHPGYEDDQGRRRLKWMTSSVRTVEQAMDYFSMYIEVLKSNFIEVNTILGNEISLEIQPLEAVSSLYVKDKGSSKQFIVIMRSLSELSRFESADQKRILQRTAEDLLKNIYKQENVNLTTLWNSFEKSNQIELAVAKSLILDSMPAMLEQYAEAKKQEDIRRALINYDRARVDKKNAEIQNDSTEKASAKLKEAANKLSNLVEHNADVQNTILSAIKRKLQDSQYQLSSIPFEILQNADDAVSEFQEIQQIKKRPTFPKQEIGHFAVLTTNHSVVLIHWGRPINYSEHNEDRFYHYRQDIERMLMLGASGKSDENVTTGKFGLGFKSTFLACDNPIVASGDLRFKIVAGCLPVLDDISSEAKEKLKAIQGTTNLQPTVVELSVKQDNKYNLLSRFKRLASLCTVFTRNINHITISEHAFRWKPDCLLSADRNESNCFLGQVNISSKKGFAVINLLVFESSLGHLALSLDSSGIKKNISSRKTHGIPAVWVNAPTQGMEAQGMLLNANFSIDTGRGSLPQGEAAAKNQNLAEKLAKEIAPLVITLIDETCQDWVTWSKKLHLAKSMTVNQFWLSFWQVVKMHESNDDDTSISQDSVLLSRFGKELFKQVVKVTKLVPSGLNIPDHTGLMEINQLRLVIKQNIPIELLSSWPLFGKKHSIQKWVSNSVYEWLLEAEILDTNKSSVVILDEEVLVNTLGHEKRLHSEDLPYLARIIESWPHYFTETQWDKYLQDIKLKSKNNSWKYIGNLVNLDALKNRQGLNTLAPAELQLHSEYHSIEGWISFSNYLEFYSPLYHEQAQWCLDAETLEQKRAVLRVLARSLDESDVWRFILNHKHTGNWLFDLNADDKCFSECKDREKIEVLRRLDDSSSSINEDMEITVGLYSLPTLSTISKWWKVHRNEYLKKYQKEFWPEEVDITGLANDDKEAWMTLFSLAVFTRMGRVTDQQHKGFVSFLNEKGWWDTIVYENPETSEQEWMAILREYAEDSRLDTRFEYWIDNFPRLYRVARWFDDYVELFKGIDYRESNQVANLLTPEADSSLSGSGLNMPSIEKTLHLGHHLIIRELLRTDVLSSEIAKKMAYMPRQRVKDFLMKLGCQEVENSQDIYDFLQDEITDPEAKNFYGDYDIPILILSKDEGLLHEISQWDEELDSRDYHA